MTRKDLKRQLEQAEWDADDRLLSLVYSQLAPEEWQRPHERPIR